MEIWNSKYWIEGQYYWARCEGCYKRQLVNHDKHFNNCDCSRYFVYPERPVCVTLCAWNMEIWDIKRGWTDGQHFWVRCKKCGTRILMDNFAHCYICNYPIGFYDVETPLLVTVCAWWKFGQVHYHLDLQEIIIFGLGVI